MTAGGVTRIVWESASPGGGNPTFDNLDFHERLSVASSDIDLTETFIREVLLAEIRVAESGSYVLGVASDSGALVRFWRGSVPWEDAIAETSLVFRNDAMLAATASATASVQAYQTLQPSLALEAGQVYQLYSRSNTNRRLRHFHAISLVASGASHRCGKQS